MTPPTPIEALRSIAEAAIRKDTDTHDQWLENLRAYECTFDGPLVLKLLRVVECAENLRDVELSSPDNMQKYEEVNYAIREHDAGLMLDTALADLQEK